MLGIAAARGHAGVVRIAGPFTREDFDACLEHAERDVHITCTGIPEELDRRLDPVRAARPGPERASAVMAVRAFADAQVWPVP